MFILAVSKSQVIVPLTSITAGIIYSSLFTIPFILVASYHNQETVGSNFSNFYLSTIGLFHLIEAIYLLNSSDWLIQTILKMPKEAWAWIYPLWARWSLSLKSSSLLSSVHSWSSFTARPSLSTRLRSSHFSLFSLLTNFCIWTRLCLHLLI